MPVSRDEAAEALRTIESTERLSGTLRGYASGAPYCFIWGLAWMAGYGFSAYQPDKRQIAWAAAIALGTVASIFVGVSGGRKSDGRSGGTWRALALAGVFAAFFAAVGVVAGPMQPRQMDAFVPLVFAALYIVGGIWGGARYGLAGLALAAVTIAGYFMAGDAFGYWMAAAGGGLLLLTGLWLRSA